MLSRVRSCSIMGIDGYIVEIETDISKGLPSFDIVGLGDAAVKESKERVRSAIKNTGLDFPTKKIIVNLAPANIRKEGSAFDLGIALGVLISTEQIKPISPEKFMFAGELSLDGKLNPVQGVLPMAVCARKEGIENLVVPIENAEEASVVSSINVLPASNLEQIVDHLRGKKEIAPFAADIEGLFNRNTDYEIDFADVKGQENAKRALEVAASGGHNCLLIGSPGSGKTMLAKRLPTILPNLTFEEALEVTKIHSIAGTIPCGISLITTRPFRFPHHTISPIGLVGGGKYPKPGEISLAHYGILFLDEVPEFGKTALEVLRQPLEDETVTISRLNTVISYPASVTLVCTANPCKCGNFLDPEKNCTCTPGQVQRYLGRLSGPLLDRMDIHIEVPSVKYSDFEKEEKGESSSAIKNRVNKVRKLQLERYNSYRIFTNSQMSPILTKKFCKLDKKSKNLLKDAFERLGLSARAYNRILKVSRTIADMEGSERIKSTHIAEAIQYRSLDRRFWLG